MCVCPAPSQRPVLGLVLGEDVLGAPELFPQVGHFLPQSRVLLLQEAGPDGDLVFLEASGIPGALSSQIVLPAPSPVFVILHFIRDEDLSSLLDHRLWFQLLGRELALARVEDLLTRDAGQSQVSRVGLVADGDLDGVWVDGAGGVSGVWEA